MTQVIRARPLRPWERLRFRLERWYYEVGPQAAVVAAFVIACGLGIMATLVLGGLMDGA